MIKLTIDDEVYAEIKLTGMPHVTIKLDDGTRIDILSRDIRIAPPGTSRHADGTLVYRDGEINSRTA